MCDSGAATGQRIGAPGLRGVRVTASVVAAMIAAVLLVSGCGSDDAAPPQTSATGVALPADFPTAEVPLIAGATVLSAGGSADEGFNVTVQGPANTTAALDTAVKALTSNGFREVQRTIDGGNKVVVVTASKAGKNYTVEVGSVAGAAGGANSVFYQISLA